MSWVLVQKHLVRKCLHAPFFFTVGLWYFTISFTCRLSHSLWFPPDVQSYSFLAARDWDISDPELQLFCWQIWIYSRALVFVTLVGVDPLTQICNEPLASHPFFFFFLLAFSCGTLTPLWVAGQAQSYVTLLYTEHQQVFRAVFFYASSHSNRNSMCVSVPCRNLNVTMGNQT